MAKAKAKEDKVVKQDKPKKKEHVPKGIKLNKPIKAVRNGFVLNFDKGEYRFKDGYPYSFWKNAVKALDKEDYKWL